MVLLVLGVALWWLAHLFAVVEPPPRAALITKLGEGPYKGLFSLAILASIGLMIVGWRGASPRVLYASPSWAFTASLVLVFVALVFLVASSVPSNLKRLVRHPQLTGMATWAAGHLLSNGDSRSLVLFGALGVWALLSMVLINRRDGAWQRPQPRPASAEVLVLVIAVGAFAALYAAHALFAGVALPLTW